MFGSAVKKSQAKRRRLTGKVKWYHVLPTLLMATVQYMQGFIQKSGLPLKRKNLIAFFPKSFAHCFLLLTL